MSQNAQSIIFLIFVGLGPSIINANTIIPLYRSTQFVLNILRKMKSNINWRSLFPMEFDPLTKFNLRKNKYCFNAYFQALQSLN